MPMSGPAYMHASMAIPGLTANQHTGNGRDHLRMAERPEVHIIFPSCYSSDYSLSRVIQHVNYTQVPNFDKNEKILWKNQNGFPRNRSTTSQILTKLWIVEGARAKYLEATILFVDFSKAFDSIHWGKMEQILLAYTPQTRRNHSDTI